MESSLGKCDWAAPRSLLLSLGCPQGLLQPGEGWWSLHSSAGDGHLHNRCRLATSSCLWVGAGAD